MKANIVEETKAWTHLFQLDLCSKKPIKKKIDIWGP